MLKLTSSRLQQYWGLLVAGIAVTSLLPCVGIRTDGAEAYVNGHWVRFIAYGAASFLAMLAWKRWNALAISAAVAVLSTGLEIARASAKAQPPDTQFIVINGLAVAAGILLGLNILARRSRTGQADI